MTFSEAVDLIRPGIIPARGIWADIGAGSGLFSKAMMEILEEGKVIALDNNPHLLFSLHPPPHLAFEFLEADFHDIMDLPAVDGILMANSLHYADDHFNVLQNVLTSLKPGGTFLMIEYDTEIPNPIWVPNPLSLARFKELCSQAGLREPEVISRRKSVYNDGEMYVASTMKIEN
ncbi:MAG: class I SAM-dependent methyltransferase [Saprospiraceae bacterium]|nr:class I SAM-dependent methyltransferase [Saprospiraceae bacterium]